MNKQDQRDFVIDLCDRIKGRLLNRVNDVPENWDGHELRQWIADTYVEQTDAGRYLDRKRAKAYRNAVLISNL